jgi:general secretion pathway protein L
MKAAIVEGFHHWINAVATTLVAMMARFNPPRIVRLVEEKGGHFLLHSDNPLAGPACSHPIAIPGQVDSVAPPLSALSGYRVELTLLPDRFLFRPLEIPRRAVEFLEGIVRAQIDRLTPWNAGEVAFGYSTAVDAGGDRMAVTVAASARAVIRPYLEAMAAVGAQSVEILVSQPNASPPIKVWHEDRQAATSIASARKLLLIVLCATMLMAGATFAATALMTASLDDQHEQVARQIADIRAVAGGREVSDAKTAERALARRKHDAPSTVIALDSLSQVLPDHTYLQELRVEGDKLRLIGITADAPSLISIIEGTGIFTRASFFAPTTRSPSDPGERFHIEAVIQPLAASRS